MKQNRTISQNLYYTLETDRRRRYKSILDLGAAGNQIKSKRGCQGFISPSEIVNGTMLRQLP